MQVKWNGKTSKTKNMNGGGAQGGLLGILEYLSQNNDCAGFLSDEDRYKYIDDLSILEIINLISVGISSYNCKLQIPSDIGTENKFIPPENISTQKHLNQINDWTNEKKMMVNSDKSKYMIVNYTRNYQFNTRLVLDENLLKQVAETRLLGVIVDERLSWQSNTSHIVKKAYKRMTILHKLYEFAVPLEDLIDIFILYIRSVLESSAAVWHSSLTEGQVLEIERVQKVALRIILKDEYINYDTALQACNLLTLHERREDLCATFAKKCTKNPKTADMFPLNDHAYETRHPEKYLVTHANTNRLAKSSIPYMQRLLNN